MKPKLLTIIAAGALVLGALVAVNAQHPVGHGGPACGKHSWGGHLEALTRDLDLTADQQTRVQPILEQTKPQIRAIHEDAMQKTKALMETTASQIRPLLSAEQQRKLDAIRKAHEDMRNAMKELHEAKQQ